MELADTLINDTLCLHGSFAAKCIVWIMAAAIQVLEIAVESPNVVLSSLTGLVRSSICFLSLRN